MLANRLRIYRQARILPGGKTPPKIGRQVLTVSLTVKSFRLPTIVADSPRKLRNHSKRETDCQSMTYEALKTLPSALSESPR
jgi:hypothetical protein